MSACVPITQERIRAELWMGGTLISKTPFIKGFNVNKTRSQISTSFNITFEMLAGTSFSIGENLAIKAGTKNNLKRIFTGLIESTTSQPTFGKPSYFSVTLAGKGVLSQLEGKKFTRRLKAEGQGLFCLITGGSSNRPTSYYSLDKKTHTGSHTALSVSPNPARTEGENSPFVKAPSSFGNQASGGRLAEVAKDPTGGAAAGGGSFRPHTHENEEEGGPAFATYSSE